MSSPRHCQWHKLRHYTFVYAASAMMILLFEWSGWNPVSGPVSAFAILAALIVLPRVA